MKLTVTQVKHVAKLANLPLTNEEEKKYSDQLSKILDYIEQLGEVTAIGVEPTFNVIGKNNVMGEDKPSPSLTQDEALKNTAEKKDGMFVTKGVFNNE